MTDESVETLIAKRFITRRDVKAVQNSDGSYRPDRTKFTMNDLKDHVAGTRTYGHYLLSQENRCKFFCYDIDLDKEGLFRPPAVGTDESRQECVTIQPRIAWREDDPVVKPDLLVQLRTITEGLALRVKKILDIPVIMAYSGNKGMHVYGMTGEEDAETVHELAMEVLQDTSGRAVFTQHRGQHFWKHVTPEGVPNNVTVEVFPKQSSLDGKDLGNLMRLPLGVHQSSKMRYFFIDPNCGYERLQPADPFETLTNGTVWQS